jgi:ribonuclease HI
MEEYRARSYKARIPSEIPFRAALAALVKAATESSLDRECMQVLRKVSELNKVILVWIREYKGIPGDKEADKLAKAGAVEV